MMRQRFIPVLFALLLLTACAPQTAASADVSALPTSSPTATITATVLPSATPSPTPTASPTPTLTPTPTPITLPVRNGTPIPDLPYEVITAENVSHLRQIARYGYPRLLNKDPYRITADGRMIAVGTTAGIEFYDADTQEKTGGFEVEFLRSFDMTPDGRFLLTLAGENTITVWTQDGQKVGEFALEAGDVFDLKPVSLSPEGALLAVQRKKADWQEQDKVDVYRVSDGSLLDTVRGNGVVFSPDGAYLAAVFDASVRLYPVAELGEGWEKRLPQQTLPWGVGINEKAWLAFSPDGTLAAVVRAGRVDVYQVAERRLVRQVSGWTADGYNLPDVRLADGKMLIVTPAIYDSRGNVQEKAQAIVVDVASGEWLSREEVEGFACLDDGQVRMFTWKAEGEMPPYASKWMHPKLIVRDNGETMLSVVNWWAFGWHNPITSYTCTNENCEFVEFTSEEVVLPNLKFARQGDTGNIVWNEKKQDQKVVIKVPVSDWFFGYVLDEQILLWSVSYSQSNGRTLLIDLDTGKTLLQTDYVHPFRFEVVDNEVIMVTNKNRTLVFDLTERSLKNTSKLGLEKHFAFAPLAYSTVSSSTFKTFFGANETFVCYLFENFCEPIIYEDVFAMAFSTNGRFFATYGADGFIRVWGVVPEGAPVR
jgi:hypothetical protein